MLLFDLPNIINITKTYNLNKNIYFSSITSNSKLTNKNTIFIYNKKLDVKKDYVLEAQKNNIPAIISNIYLNNLSIPQFVVKDIDLEVETLLRNIYKNQPTKTIAVTGTNGKTSVVWYISNILKLLNYENITVGTLGYFKNGKKIHNISLTTPNYEEIYKYGYLNSKNKYFYVFEASSHALDQNRLRNYPIDIAAITNISLDHLDYHKNTSEYKKAKSKLFTKYLSKGGLAIINSKLEKILRIDKKLKEKNIKKIYFGKINNTLIKEKKFFTLIVKNKKFKIIKLNQETDIELENLECAINCCLALNINENKILKIISKVSNPPGRLQKIDYLKKKSSIIIDYAHTPDALEKILKAFVSNKIKPNLIFGCGGERDKSKRKHMGLVAKNFAKKVYVTDDNPRNENASIIRKNILKYCPNGIEIPDRKKAIKKAIDELKMHDTLIIAGKGHKNFQIVKNKKIKFNDAEIVKNFIK